jgi:hypothetical protein
LHLQECARAGRTKKGPGEHPSPFVWWSRRELQSIVFIEFLVFFFYLTNYLTHEKHAAA